MPQEFIRLKWSVDTKKLDRRMTRIILGFKDAGEFTLKQLGELGKTKARLLAPKDTGKTFQNIALFDSKGTERRIVAKNPTATEPPLKSGKPRKQRSGASVKYFTKGKFNLVKWMHESPSAEGHIKTGDERFMFTTAAYLRQVGGKIAASEFNKVVIKNK